MNFSSRSFALALLAAACAAANVEAAVTSLCSGWEFRRGGESAWTKVSVPHDWAIGGPFHRTNDLQVATIRQDGETVEILEPVRLRATVAVSNAVTIVATNDVASASPVTSATANVKLQLDMTVPAAPCPAMQ